MRVWREANQAPVADDDQATTTVDAPVTIDRLANDLDADGDELYVRAWEASPGASVSVGDDGALIYMPQPGFVGDDAFSYTVADGYGGEATGQVDVSVYQDCADMDCDDADPCTDDACDSTLGCQHVTHDRASDDGDACTTVDHCEAGACLGSAPVLCAALDACHVAGSCDPLTGACDDPPAADDTPCDDGDPETSPNRCVEGICVGQASVDVVDEDTIDPSEVTSEVDVQDEYDAQDEADAGVGVDTGAGTDLASSEDAI